MMTDRELELREKSGQVSTTDPFVVFLYLLTKDYLPILKLEELLERTKETVPGSIVFNNGWVGRYVLELKDQLDQLREQNMMNSGVVMTDTNVGVTGPIKFSSNEVLEEAELVLDKLAKTLTKEEFERVQQDVEDYKQDCDLDVLFKDLVIE